VLWAIVTTENRLRFPVFSRAHEDWLRAGVRLSSPHKRTYVKGVLKDQVDVSSAHPFPGLSPDRFGEGRQRMFSGSVELENPVHNRVTSRVHLNRAFRLVVPVSERCMTGKDPLRSFLAHAFLDLFFQVL